MSNLANMDPQGPFVFPARVYYVYSRTDPTVLIALDVNVEANLIRWFDTVKERVMQIETVTEATDQRFGFKRAGEEVAHCYSLQPLTMELYNLHVKNRLSSSEVFQDEEALFASFELARKNSW